MAITEKKITISLNKNEVFLMDQLKEILNDTASGVVRRALIFYHEKTYLKMIEERTIKND